MLKILHIGSHKGNLGDNLSHNGLNNILSENINNYSVKPLEIRAFYKNRNPPKRFDDDFVSYVNTFDLVIMGGGAFLDFNITGSQNGITFDICPFELEKIRIPFLISSIGCRPKSEESLRHYSPVKEFFSNFLSKENRAIFFRNDGSGEFIKHMGLDFAVNLRPVLDSGFMSDVARVNPQVNPFHRPYILLNLPIDQLKFYHPEMGYYTGTPDNIYSPLIDHYLKETAYNLVLAPHNFEDLVNYCNLLRNIDPLLLNDRVSILPLDYHKYGFENLVNAYRHADLVMGMRFHSCVLGIVLERPTIGFGNQHQQEKMWESIGRAQNHVSIMEENFIRSIVKSTENFTALDAFKPEFEDIAEKVSSTSNCYSQYFSRVV